MLKYDPVPRDAGAEWYNKEPVTDLDEALALLFPHQNDSQEGRFIATRGDTELRLGWFMDGDSGGAKSGFDYYKIDPVLVERLNKEGLIEPRKEIGWGFTRHNKEKLVLSEAGKRKHIEDSQAKRQKEKAVTSG